MTATGRPDTGSAIAETRRGPASASTSTSASVSDFSSAEYWSKRFSTETSFEWLLPSSKIIPLVLDYAGLGGMSQEGGGEGWKVLHVGCGTSTLGKDVEMALREAHPGREVRVVDTDYVAEFITPSPSPSSSKVVALDCLDMGDLKAKSPAGRGWEMILDKSTADAISCGPLIPSTVPQGGGAGEEPLDVLLRNLAAVTRAGTRWISISYSATRYSHLINTSGWSVVEMRFLASTSLPEGRRIKDPQSGQERVVWEPETGVWGWVLERV